MQTRRHFLSSLGTVGLIPLVQPFAVNPRKFTPPNIIVIMADDLGYGDLSYYGNESIFTPNIDALAAGGVRFTDFHSSGAVCSPTRAGLLTGRYQQRAGIGEVLSVARHRDQGLSQTETTFAELFQQAGYKTALFGKWHLGYKPEFNPVHHGFGEFRGYLSGNVDYISHIDQGGVYDWWHNLEQVEEEGYTTHLITRHALRFIEDNQKQPFLLYLAHEAPHYPYQGPGDKADRTVNGTFSNQGSRQDKKNAYKIMVEEMDQSVGQVVKKVRDLNLDKDTFIFFLSDNGANKMGSNGILRGYKGSLWEGGHRVPACAYWPGVIAPGRLCRQTSICLDIFPTILSAAHIKAPVDLKLDGVDLMPQLTQDRSLPQRTLFWKYKRQKAARKGDWKLVVTSNQQGKIQIELFHLDKDISEKNNLADSNKKQLRALLDELTAWEKEVESEE